MDHLAVAVCVGDHNSGIAADVVVGGGDDAADAVAGLAEAGWSSAVRFAHPEKYGNEIIK